MPLLRIICSFLSAVFAFSVAVLAQQPAAVLSSTPATTQSAPSTKITNARVIEMTKIGLDDDVVIARIKHGSCEFQLADNDLVELKKAGVSSKVVAAMLDSAPTPDPSASAPEPSDGKIRLLVTDSQSWETRGSGGGGGNKNGWGGASSFSGGARPQTAEIIKTINQRCPEYVVTNNLGKADFVLTLDHEGGKGALAHRNKVAVFNRDGDVIFSNSTRELGNAVKDACAAIAKAKK
jgi:hypothetical protein